MYTEINVVNIPVRATDAVIMFPDCSPLSVEMQCILSPDRVIQIDTQDRASYLADALKKLGPIRNIHVIGHKITAMEKYEINLLEEARLFDRVKVKSVTFHTLTFPTGDLSLPSFRLYEIIDCSSYQYKKLDLCLTNLQEQSFIKTTFKNLCADSLDL